MIDKGSSGGHFPSMRVKHPIARMLQAVLFAAVGMWALAGSASAHQSHGPSSEHVRPSVPQMTVGARERSGIETHLNHALGMATYQAIEADHASGPCSEDEGSSHLPGNCCNVGCHTALSFGIGDVPVPVDPAATRIPSLTSALTGLAGGGTERPPRHS